MWDENYLLSELPSDEETEEEVTFIFEVLQLKRDSILLDLCCGQGRHGVQLASSGVNIIGVDSSRFLLQETSNYAGLDAHRIHLVEGDMRYLPVKPVCDAVVNLFTSFGFFDEADNKKVLSEVASVLKPGGKFLVDYWNPYAVTQLDRSRNWWWISESTLALAEVEYQPKSGQLLDHRTIIEIPTKTIRQTVNPVRFYFPTELERLLEEVGLHVCAMYGDFDRSGFSIEARRMITVAEKF